MSSEDDTFKKKKRLKDFPYKTYLKVILHGTDAQSETGWLSVEQIEKLKPAMSKTKGWIYKETDEYIITFGTYSTDANDNIIEFGEVLCVPKNWI
jgi:hypothetical protein